MTKLGERLVQECPIDYQRECSFETYPVCNEYYWHLMYDELDTSLDLPTLFGEPRQPTHDGVAILFGESNFISLAPLFKKLGITTVILCDIQPDMHLLNEIQQNDVLHSETLEEFNSKWDRWDSRKHREGQDKEEFLKEYGHESWNKWDELREKVCIGFWGQRGDEHLGQYHFTSSEKRYSECKEALEGIEIVQIDYDIFDPERSKTVADIIHDEGREIQLVNLSNIYQYDKTGAMIASANNLLQHTMSTDIIASKIDEKSTINSNRLIPQHFTTAKELNQQYFFSDFVHIKPVDTEKLVKKIEKELLACIDNLKKQKTDNTDKASDELAAMLSKLDETLVQYKYLKDHPRYRLELAKNAESILNKASENKLEKKQHEHIAHLQTKLQAGTLKNEDNKMTPSQKKD